MYIEIQRDDSFIMDKHDLAFSVTCSVSWDCSDTGEGSVLVAEGTFGFLTAFSWGSLQVADSR